MTDTLPEIKDSWRDWPRDLDDAMDEWNLENDDWQENFVPNWTASEALEAMYRDMKSGNRHSYDQWVAMFNQVAVEADQISDAESDQRWEAMRRLWTNR